MDEAALRRAMGKFATGVTVITVNGGEAGVRGMTANAFTSVSLEPPLVLVCVGHHRQTYSLIQRTGDFGVSVLAQDQQALASHFANATRDRTADAAFEYAHSRRGVPYIPGALAYFDCQVVASHVHGDHTVFVARVHEAAARKGRPLLFFEGRYTGLDVPQC